MNELMKRLAFLAAAAITIGAAGGTWAATTGNGSESGAHYTPNIIGTKAKNPDMTGGSGHRIFVPLEGPTKIALSPGEFQVLDANGTDKNGASLQLPILTSTATANSTVRTPSTSDRSANPAARPR